MLQNCKLDPLPVLMAHGLGKRNLKLSEFTSWENWDFKLPADEFELFDLDEDKWELNNIYATTDPQMKQALHDKLEALHRCQGSSCN